MDMMRKVKWWSPSWIGASSCAFAHGVARRMSVLSLQHLCVVNRQRLDGVRGWECRRVVGSSKISDRFIASLEPITTTAPLPIPEQTQWRCCDIAETLNTDPNFTLPFHSRSFRASAASPYPETFWPSLGIHSPITLPNQHDATPYLVDSPLILSLQHNKV